VEYQVAPVTDNETYSFSFIVNDIDTVKVTDCVILTSLSGLARPIVQITKYNESTDPYQLTHESGLSESEFSLGKYVDVSLTLYDTVLDVFIAAQIKIYYRISDLDRTGNGLDDDLEDFNESTLALYYFNESSETWTKLTNDLEWIFGQGVNQTDIELYGENYAGYIWVNTAKLPLFGIGGLLNNYSPTSGLWELLQEYWIYIACTVVVIVIVIIWARKRKR
jgi:hypothetical protein